MSSWLAFENGDFFLCLPSMLLYFCAKSKSTWSCYGNWKRNAIKRSCDMAVDFVALKHAQELDHLSTLRGTYLGENKS